MAEVPVLFSKGAEVAPLFSTGDTTAVHKPTLTNRINYRRQPNDRKRMHKCDLKQF